MTTPEADTPVGAGARSADRGRTWALVSICVVAAVLYGWHIGSGQMGNPYYSAAVKSMTHGFTNFLFGSFDALGVQTVDKPPMSLWPQVFSVWLFGYHGWALLLPQVVEGVAAVFLLHRTVRAWAGENAALLAAVIMTLTPITVVINRTNNPDTLLVLLLVAAAYALTRSIQAPVSRSRTTWLLWCAFFIGCGFTTKMLQAWIVVPGFALAYLAGTTGPVGRRIVDLLGATGVLVVSSFWWVALHDWWPGAKPYVAGSTDGTAWDLVFGYNGFGRVFGQSEGPSGATASPNPVASMPPPRISGPTTTLGADDGITRMFSDQVGGQISWLLPLSLFVLLLVAVVGIRRTVARRPVDPARRAGWILWGSWLLVTGLVFSYAQGVWHPYYTTMLAPAIAAICAAGLTRLWRYYRDSATETWILLPTAIAITATWAIVLVSRNASWHGWARWAVLFVAAAAIAALVVARTSPAWRHTIGRPATIAGLLAVLLTPGLWSVVSTQDGNAGTAAGPTTNGTQVQQLPGGRGMIVTGSGPPDGGLSDQQRHILDYAEKNDGDAEIDLAINSATAAGGYIVNSDATVIGMGGFTGSDNSPTTDQLREWVEAGALKFVLGNPPPGPNGQVQFGGLMGAAQDRQRWVERNCTVVDPRAYSGAQTSDGPVMGGDTLYRCD